MVSQTSVSQSNKMTRYIHNMVCFMFLTILVPGICSASELKRRLELLRQNYHELPTIHFRTTSALSIAKLNAGEQDSTVVTYEYWGDGEKYRIDYSGETPDGKEIKRKCSIAYDGKRFQNFDRVKSLFHYRREDIKYTPEIGPNPMLYPLIFLSPAWKTPGSHLRFKDLNDDEIWDDAYRNAKPINNEVSQSGMAFELPCGSREGSECICQVFFGSDPDYIPVKIVQCSKDHKDSISFEISDIQMIKSNGKKIFLPKSTRFQVTVDGKAAAREEATFEILEVGVDLPPEIFSINFARADKVYDDDAKVFLRHPRFFAPSLDDVAAPKKMSVLNPSDKKVIDSKTTIIHPNNIVSVMKIDSKQKLKEPSLRKDRPLS